MTELAVWIAHPIPTPDGTAYEPWRPMAQWAVEENGAHELAREQRRFHDGALVAVRPKHLGEPLLPEGMPDYYDLPPYA
jgi:hypothetical protein